MKETVAAVVIDHQSVNHIPLKKKAGGGAKRLFYWWHIMRKKIVRSHKTVKIGLISTLSEKGTSR